MSAEEWEALSLEAELQNDDREYDEGREYTEVEKHLLIKHYTKIFDKTALALGPLRTEFSFLVTAIIILIKLSFI